jgi:hypothetical protein
VGWGGGHLRARAREAPEAVDREEKGLELRARVLLEQLEQLLHTLLPLLLQLPVLQERVHRRQQRH